VLRSQFSGCPTVLIQDIVYNIFRLSACSMIAIVSGHWSDWAVMVRV